MVVLIDGLGGSNTCKIYYNTVPAYILKDTPIDKGGNLSSPSRFFAVYERREERRGEGEEGEEEEGEEEEKKNMSG